MRRHGEDGFLLKDGIPSRSPVLVWGSLSDAIETYGDGKKKGNLEVLELIFKVHFGGRGEWLAI